MNEKRKSIILSEIKYWKQHNLLPKHYCDFLSTLYEQGRGTEEIVRRDETSVLQKEKRSRNWKVLSIIGFALLLGVAMQLVNDGTALLGGALGVIALLCYAIFQSKKPSIVLPVIYIASAFLFLMTSLKLWLLNFPEQPMVLIALLIINCIIWIFAGRLLRLLYFTLSGVIGLVAIIVFLII